jgi:hypothetical protein
MQPEQATFLLQTILPKMEREHQLTRRIIESIPVDRGDYRPDEVSKSAFDLAWHIAASENRFLDGVASGVVDFTGPARPEPLHNSADVAAWYAEAFSRNFSRVKQLSGDALAKMLDFRGMFQMPAVERSCPPTCGPWARRSRRSTARATMPPRRARRRRPRQVRHPFEHLAAGPLQW